MFSSDRAPTYILIATAMVTLLVSYGWMAFTDISFSAGPVSFAGVVVGDLLFPVVAISLIGSSSIFHWIQMWPALYASFGDGYRSSPRVIELVRREVVIASQDPTRLPPYGDLRASFRPSIQSVGRFTRPDGTLSDVVLVRLEGKVHWSAVRSGVRRMVGRQYWLSVYGPLLLGGWALISVMAIAIGLTGTCVTKP